MTPWHVYVLVSADGGRTYVGVTSDLPRRLAQHNGEQPGGAKSTRAGRPWSVGTTFGPYTTRGQAQAVEHRVKRRSGRDRLRPLPAPDPHTVPPTPPAPNLRSAATASATASHAARAAAAMRAAGSRAARARARRA